MFLGVNGDILAPDSRRRIKRPALEEVGSDDSGSCDKSRRMVPFPSLLSGSFSEG